MTKKELDKKILKEFEIFANSEKGTQAKKTKEGASIYSYVTLMEKGELKPNYALVLMYKLGHLSDVNFNALGMPIHSQLKNIRLSKELKPSVAARLLNLDHSYYKKAEKGKLPKDEIEKIIQSLKDLKIKKRKVYAPFEKVRAWVHENVTPSGIDSIPKWKKYINGEYPNAKKLPVNFHSNPFVYYKGKGYKDINDFFGLETVETLSYNDASKKVKKNSNLMASI